MGTEIERGSVEFYREYGGDFVKSFLKCYGQADANNRLRLARAFPQMAAAMEMDSHMKAPPRFLPDPFAAREYDGDRG